MRTRIDYWGMSHERELTREQREEAELDALFRDRSRSKIKYIVKSDIKINEDYWDSYDTWFNYYDKLEVRCE